MNQEEYIKLITPLSEEEIRELLGACLVGSLPKATMSRVFATLGSHAAFVAKVKEVVEGMEHDEDCRAVKCVVCGGSENPFMNHYCGPIDSHNFKAGKCTCPRGKLLAMCEEGVQ